MGRVKDEMIEKVLQDEEKKLAEFLGITYEELCETNWRRETEESEDGFIYNYVITFSDDSPKQILNKIEGLNSNNQVFITHVEVSNDEYYDYEDQYEAIVSNNFIYDRFLNEIENVRLLNEIITENYSLLSVLKRQLYINAIGILETFLSETFIKLTNENDVYFRNFIETYPKFKERKFQLNDIYFEYNNLRETAKKEMLDVIYHNLSKVKNMFISTFKIHFPDIVELSKAINTRHDLVHRNGKTKDGVDITINKEIVIDLLNTLSEFVEELAITLKLKN
jgi:hypothetical protein